MVNSSKSIVGPLVEGKTLLVLAGDADTVSLVKRAKELGCKVIVSDYYTNPVLSPCKAIADEAWDISWNDVEALSQAAKVAGVDGVMAGYSEPRIQSVIEVCAKLGLPCYSNIEQLDITRDKIKFKEACREAGVPVVREYPAPESVSSFPVIVKPVDRAGSIGVGIAHDEEELKSVFTEAQNASYCGKVIIEDYIQDGMKVDFYYDVMDRHIVYLGGTDVIFASDNGSSRVVQSAWIMPSRVEELYLRRVDSAMRRMIENIGITNGYLFVSGFFREDGSFVFFECGFRLCGGHLYNYFEDCGFPNTLDLFILLALTGTASALKCLDRRLEEPKCVELNFYAREGTVEDINGFGQIEKNDDCKISIIHAHKGQECKEDKAILSKLGIVGFVADDTGCLVEDIREAYEDISVFDSNGKDMIYDRIDPDAISGWWD